jgi:hypothetical protein
LALVMEKVFIPCGVGTAFLYTDKGISRIA